jgi:hypothetical protein
MEFVKIGKLSIPFQFSADLSSLSSHKVNGVPNPITAKESYFNT